MLVYKIYDDGDGHKFLIPPSNWDTLMDLEAIGDEDVLLDFLEAFKTLEGQSYLVVLESEFDL